VFLSFEYERWEPDRLSKLVSEMNTLNCRIVADALASTAAGYVVLAPTRYKEVALQSTLQGFRDACGDRGVMVCPDDLAYYLAVVEAQVAQITACLGEVGHA
jgi:hypothetical protein